MEAEHIVLHEEKIRSVMLTKLLVYLLVYRGKPVTTDELIDALYMEGEVENPAGALKNLVYRLRTLLQKEYDRDDFIISGRGNYQWNPDIMVSVDTENFESLIEQTKNANLDRYNAIAIYEEAVAIYQGDFMDQLVDAQWVMPLSSYYHALFLGCVRELAKLYAEMGNYERLESLCIHALRIEDADETIYYYLIMARERMGNWNLAMKSYDEAVAVMTDIFGTGHYKMLSEIYDELLETHGRTEIAKIGEVTSELVEEEANGAFICGYPVFRELYRIEQRRIMRSGASACLLLLTLTIEGRLREKVKKFRIKNAMDKLEVILLKSLRKGDVASQYNDSQFVVLLTGCDCDGCSVVAARITENFRKKAVIHESIKLAITSEEVVSFVLNKNEL